MAAQPSINVEVKVSRLAAVVLAVGHVTKQRWILRIGAWLVLFRVEGGKWKRVTR